MLNARLPFVDPVLNSVTVCKNTLSLNKLQLRLCRKEPEVFASALQGVQIAIHECQHQFRFRRWNCASLGTKNKSPFASSLFSKGICFSVAFMCFNLMSNSSLWKKWTLSLLCFTDILKINPRF